MFRMNMRQTVAVACLGQGGSSLGPPLAQALGTQTWAFFIFPLAPRAQAFKYADKWMDIAMQIVSSLLRNVPENHIFPSLPSGTLNTQNQVNVSIYAEVCKYSTM